MSVPKEIADHVWEQIKHNIFIINAIYHNNKLDDIYDINRGLTQLNACKRSFYAYCDSNISSESKLESFLTNFVKDKTDIKKFD